jgi:hypothetical protein
MSDLDALNKFLGQKSKPKSDLKEILDRDGIIFVEMKTPEDVVKIFDLLESVLGE